jgi:hypothetical protein
VVDTTGQRRFRASDVRRDMTVGEAFKRFLPRLGLGSRDRTGAPQTFRMRLDREGRNLFPSQRIGDAVENGAQVTVERSIQAG